MIPSKAKTAKNKTSRKVKTKNIKLRAFSISPQTPKVTSPSPSIVDLAINKLSNTVAKDRVLILNKDDPNKHSDTLPYFDVRNRTLLGVIMKISQNDNVQVIANTLMNQKKFSVGQLKSNNIDDNKVYLSHYYFAMNDKFLVTNLSMNTTIRGFQAYINWFIKEQLFEFTPMVINAPDLKMEDLRQLTIADPMVNKTNDEVKKKWIDLKGVKDYILKAVLKDVKDLDEVEMGRVISARLLLKFIKPKDMTVEDYKKIMGFYLKPISDLENVVFTNKNKQKFSADKLLRTENVHIDVDENGFISEPQLWDAMTGFLAKL